MPVNPYLLNQAAQGTPSPLASFLPAFQQAQDRQLKQGLLEEERQQRHMSNLFKWNEYVQKARQDESSQKNRAAFQEKFSALDQNDPNYGMEAHRLATMYGQDLEGASLIPKGEDAYKYQDLGDRIGVFQGGNLVQTIRKGATPTANANYVDVFDVENNQLVGSFPSGSVPSEYQGQSKYRVVKSAELTGGTEDVGLEQPGNRDNTRQTIAGMQNALQLIDQGIAAMGDSKTNTGVAGWAKRNVVDPLVQLADIALPEGVGQSMYEGMDVSGATRIETIANFLSGQLLPAITGETSGRFTEAERAMAQQTIALLETSKSTRSVQQALSDVKGILETAIRRNQSLLGGQGSNRQQGDYPSPTTQDEYDSLQSGDVYISPDDGKLYRKP